ncbi:MAG: hypothetical protein QG670_87 [Thermoproteota archaeon]|nr:hypothetical protein [Thermoproteota archaeon]
MNITKEKNTISNAFKLSLIAVSAALYAVSIALTAFIPTPWGIGSFRPGVLVPAFFALMFGPIIGGVGAGIGCFIGDLFQSYFGLTTPLLSLVAGVPGNFIGFFLLGLLVKKYRSWSGFTISSFISLLIGNLVCAVGVVGYLSFFFQAWAALPIDVKLGAIVGFTFFWVGTMIPFVIPLMPLLVRSVNPVLLENRGNLEIKKVTWGKTTGTLKSAIFVSLVLAGLYIIVMFTPLGDLIFSTLVTVSDVYTYWVKTLMLIASVIVIAFGIIITVLLQRKKIS